MLAEREAWLNQEIEEALEPSLPICDPHHHLWYNSDNNYTAEDFLEDISGGHHVCQTVFVESRMMLKEDAPPEMQPVGETEFVRNIVSGVGGGTDGAPVIAAGIIGFADLTRGAAVAAVLEAHIAAGKNRFRGIRYITARDDSLSIKARFEVPQALLMDRKFREGFAALRRYGLSFDAWLYHPQLAELVDLAREFPDIPIIVDHAGGPLGIGPYELERESVFQDWKRGIRELSYCGNVYIKLGGLGMKICGHHWDEAEKPPDSIELARVFQPYYLWCIERFGVHRCMFESNFPVDKASYSYTTLWNAFKRLTEDFSHEERLALFHDTAVNVYRLSN
jgi:L-fuconolactonase